jgi:L-malate glycosyltransferase
MKVLFLNYEYPPLGGGAANATFYILREYAKIPGLDVDLITSSHDNNFHLEKMGDRVRIHKLPIGKSEKNLHFQSKKDLLVYSWKAYRYGKKLLKKEKYDISHSFFSVPCGFLSLLFKWQFRIPYVVSLRGADVPGYSERFSCLYSLLKPIIILIWNKSGAVVSNSEGLKELALKSKPDQKIEIVFNGIDTDFYKPDFEKKPGNEFIITPGASRITARKGLIYLVKAVEKLRDDYPQIRLKILAEGNEKENLTNYVQMKKLEKEVSFPGFIPKDRTPSYYQEASIFVLPSLNEGMSNAMLEAVSSGLPILATNTGGSKELVGERENGFIIKEKDVQDIIDKIKILIENKDLLKAMGEKSRERSFFFSWKSVADKYVAIYGRIL